MAAASNLGKWSGQATLDAGPWVAGTRQVEQSAKTLEGRLEQIFGRMGAAVKFPGFAVGFENLTTALGVQAGRSLGAGINEELQKGLNLGFLNNQLGTSIEWLSKLQTVTGENSVSQEQFITGMQRLHSTLGEASMGGAAQVEIFEKLGLSIERLRGQSFEATFTEIADALSKVESRAERARIATELFGRGEGARMLRSIRGGRAGLDASMGDVTARGGFQTEEGQARLEELDNAMDRVTTAWDNSWRNFLTLTAPALTATFNEINRIIDGIGDAWRHITGGTAPTQTPTQQPDNRTFEELAPAYAELEEDRARAQERLAQAQAEAEASRQAMHGAADAGDSPAYNLAYNNMQSDLERAAQAQALLERTQGRMVAVNDRYIAIIQADMEAITAETEAREASARRWDRMQDQRDQAENNALSQQLMTPLETFRNRVEHLGELFTRLDGGMTQETYQRALTQAFAGLGGNTPERRLPGSFDAGSAESLSLINQNRANPQQTAMERVRETLQTALEVQREQRTYQQEMRDALKERTAQGAEFEDVFN